MMLGRFEGMARVRSSMGDEWCGICDRICSLEMDEQGSNRLASGAGS